MIALKLHHKLKEFDVDITLDLKNKGSIIGIFGTSGHGKSTILRCLAGLESKSEYLLTFQNTEYVNVLAEQSPCVLNRQKSLLFPHLSVKENLKLVAENSNWRTVRSLESDKTTERLPCRDITIAQVTTWFDLAGLLAKKVNELSGGEQQRVSVARSLLSGKPLLLLDEPFSAIDWTTRLSCLSQLRQIASKYNIAIIIVSHSLKELALCTDYIVHVKTGKIVGQGEVQTQVNKLSRQASASVFAQLNLKFQHYLEQYQLSHWQLVDVGDEQGPSVNTQQSIFIKDYMGQNDEQGIDQAALNAPVTKRVNLDADQVSISRSLNKDTSMLNQLSAELVEITEQEQLALLTLKASGQTLFAQISKLSLDNLRLKVGETVYAQFKAL